MDKSNQPPQQVKLTPQEVNALKARIEACKLPPSDIKLILGLLSFNQWLQERLSRAKLTIKRLRQLFGFSNEKLKKRKPPAPEDAPMVADPVSTDMNDTNNRALLAGISDPDATSVKNPLCASIVSAAEPQWDPTRNHGRHGADQYTGCVLHEVAFEDEHLKAGYCPDCALSQTEARVYTVDPTVLVLLSGQPVVSGSRYALAKARCGVCQKYFTAPTPKAIMGCTKYSPQCISSLAIHHYYAGLPFYRLEMLQQAQGVPLPDATQADLMKSLYKDVIMYVTNELMLQAANGNTLFLDDTTGHILEHTSYNKRTGSPVHSNVHATALLSESDGHRIYLYSTNKLTAGKQLSELLNNRSNDDTFGTMSDASASNFPELADETLLARWIIFLCLAHSRRRFVELLDDGDENMALVLEVIAQVYANDKQCKQQQFNDEQRLQYHQKHSQPIMEALRVWLNNLLLYHHVEPNSRSGEAIMYLLKRWYWLTQFLRVPGAPIDNNLCEQAIKILIRYRKNSLFYRTQQGANIGDAVMSVLHTAHYADVNVFDYLTILQTNANDVQQSAADWLPWTYKETLAKQATIKNKAQAG